MGENFMHVDVELESAMIYEDDSSSSSVSFTSKTRNLSMGSDSEVHRRESFDADDPNSTTEIKPTLTILDGKFYKLVQSKSTIHNYTAACQLCKIEIKGNRHSTHNFLSHLKRKHGEEAFTDYKNYLDDEKRRRCEKTLNNDSVQGQRKIRQLTQQDFETKMSKFIVNSMIPFRAIEDKYLIDVMDDLGIINKGLRLPSRRSVVRKVEELFDENNKNVREQLKNVDYVCTSADIWSGRRRSFFGVTAHWVDSNYQRKSAALACKRFTKTHSYDRIASLLQNIHLNFGLTYPKIVATVTDNGSNFVKAFKTFGIEKKVIESSAENEPYLFPDIVDEDESSSDSEDDVSNKHRDSASTSSTQSNQFSQEIKINLPNHYRCASHTLHLCATSDVTNGFKEHPALAERHKNTLSKCSALWNLASRPKTAEVIQEVLGHTLSRPGETRWNSLFESLKQIYSIKEKIHELYRNLKMKSSQQLMEEEFLYIQEYLECSEPLASIIDILQGENNVFFGMLFPGLVALRRKVHLLNEKTWLYSTQLVAIYKSSVEKRFDDFFRLNSATAESAAIAAISHPAFKKRWLPCIDVQLQDKILQLFKNAVIKEIISATTNDDTLSLSTRREREKTPAFMTFFDFGVNEEQAGFTDNGEAKAEIQISNYFGCPLTNVKSLDAFPAIKKVFLKYNTPLPSSAPVERLFSFATLTNRPKSNRLTDKNFEIRVVLKANEFLFSEAQ